jgi:hypothetical protein
MKLSRDAIMFFGVEIRNEGGVQPATLGSAQDSFLQADEGVLLDFCGYKNDYPESSFVEELGKEIRKLIRTYGKKYPLDKLTRR